ncbi:stomatin-like protein 2, mitochondrial [Pezoporus wallicus]|uniref:stomatin-like protein 2, mitochondrial n=1 Tax=Pezoporus wallicus TaxID=35540 RepID=UPI00254C9EC3|nr:stomatin-like protein 2, mitochondrial [Pezoporus wallicus]XP_061333243.1 stomatin-like protein 2, mitochondrial [Pezoporus flaviventris]
MLARAALRAGPGLGLLQRSHQLKRAAWLAPAPHRLNSSLPMNIGVLFVPQQEAWVVERMGKFHRILEPGLNFLIPLLDRIRYVQSLKEIVINVPEQSAVTLDNVTLQIDGVLYLRVMDPYKASYGVEDPEYAVTQLAQTTMRSELGKLSLDRVFRERESLNANIVDAINQASDCWGIRCLRYEIKDIHVPPRVKESMQMQVEAERRKRATVLESEGTRESAINVAEGQKQAQILASEAEKAEQINKAAGEANAMLVKARAKAEAIQLLAAALAQQHGSAAASLSVAEQYVNAFSNLAKDSNTLLLPSNTGDVTNMVAQALAIYSTLTKQQTVKTQDEAPPACEEPQPPTTEVLKAEQAGSS